MPGRRVTSAEPRHRPESKHIEAAIRGINDACDDYEAKQNVQRVRRGCRSVPPQIFNLAQLVYGARSMTRIVLS